MPDDIQLRIHGMDCAEEVALLKRELLPVVGSEDRLGFDVLNGKLTLSDLPSNVTLGDVLVAIEKTGLRAEQWNGARPDSGPRYSAVTLAKNSATAAEPPRRFKCRQ